MQSIVPESPFRINGYCAGFANDMRGGKLETVDPEEVEVGETIVVKPGEKSRWTVLCWRYFFFGYFRTDRRVCSKRSAA